MRDLSSSLPSPSRRGLLKGVGGAALLGAGIPLLSACGSSGSSSDPKTVSLGSNASDAVPKKAFAEIYAAFKKQSGITVDVNTKDHNTFQEQINSYLQGTPDDVFNWFAGYRMQFFAAKNLASPIDDVWDKIGGNFPDAMKKLSKGADGKYYFVPLYTYPWAIFYRKSVFAQHGYEVPTTWDAFVTLCKQMKKDGLVPIAFGDKDAWPAMGTFDQINFRLNGYDFHVELMAGKAAWTDAKVKAVFDHWAELLPYHQDGFMGRTWQDAAQTLVSKKAGMYVLGSFVGQQFTNKATWTTWTSSPSRRSTPRTGRTPSRLRPTASWSPRRRRTRPVSASCSSTWAPRRRSRSTSRPTPVWWPPPARPTPPRTRRCRRRRTR